MLLCPDIHSLGAGCRADQNPQLCHLLPPTHTNPTDTTFRFTPRTTRIAVALGIVVPSLMYAATANQHAKWDMQGRTKTESLLSGRLWCRMILEWKVVVG